MCKRSACIIMAGLALGSLLLVGSPAGAQSVYAPYIDQREANQQQRIHQGIDSGALGPGETRYLNREQGRIDRAEDRMQADGHLSPRERQRLNQMQNHASRDIYRLKHNDRTTAGWSGHNNYGWGGNAYAPGSERREAYQEQRIHQGIDSGALTPGEARYLNREQARIDRAQDRMMADGRLSPRERQRLNQMQNQAGRDIYRLEHNNRTADGNQAGWHGNNRGWDRGNYGWQGHNPNYAGNHPGGNPNNRGWHGSGNSGWHGNNPGGPGNHPGGNDHNRGWHANGNSGWHGNNPAGSGPTSGGNTPGGTATPGHNQGQGHGSYGRHGNNPAGSGPAPGGNTTNGTTTARNPQGWQGNYARHGQPGTYQQPGARPGQAPAFQGRQPQPQYQQARQPMPQTTMRPNTNMMARQPMPQTAMRPNTNMMRQPSGVGGMVNRANFSGGGAGLRRR